ISASETPKSKLETSSFPPVSTPAPAPKPLSNRSCCHFSGSCFGRGSVPAAARAITGRFRAAPPRPPRPPRPAPRWLRFSLMMSSRDMSILSAMMAARSDPHFRPRCARAGSGRAGPPPPGESCGCPEDLSFSSRDTGHGLCSHRRYWPLTPAVLRSEQRSRVPQQASGKPGASPLCQPEPLAQPLLLVTVSWTGAACGGCGH
uniref:Uncharacterized protein n=1 Tax=Malurus cyaneus samueli TaxID=2593467 RepID=A0A8C5UA85_9PASS